jgi:hypothetical protein
MKNAIAGVLLSALLAAVAVAKEETVATAVYGRVGNGYKRTKLKDGTFKPEYYALSNGGRLHGTGTDNSIDRVTYPEVAEIVQRLLARQNYHYARDKDQARLLLVLNWGNTRTYNRVNYEEAIKKGGVEMENQLRDQINEYNARVLGYLDDLTEANDIRRTAGLGDRYTDLITDVEDARYYIMVSAYDFRELAKSNQRKLLWQVRVSVRTAGNRFDEGLIAMLSSASKYFGQDSGRLVRIEEPKGSVEMGDIRFLGQAEGESKPGEKR